MLFNPFIIAEMSGNHNQSLGRALAIVEAAAACGVDALKIQTYTADTMTIDVSEGEFMIQDPSSLWAGETLYNLYKKAYTPWEWHQPIFEKCRELGIIPFSTPFDFTAVDFLENINCPIYKIASFENTDLPLLKRVAQTGKPVIVSTGMACLEEITECVETLRANGCREITLLKCTSTYPANPRDSHLKTIPDMKARFPDCRIGLSDHTMGLGVSLAAIGLGAEVIEKHFCLSRAEGGVDSAFSMEPEEMKILVEEARKACSSLGEINYLPTKSERKSLAFRRSLYFVKDISQGERIDETHIRAIRPGSGLPPKYYSEILGKVVLRDMKRGAPVSWDSLAL